LIYVITNSYPEEKVMFSTYEFDYVIEHFTNYQIASFSPANKMKNDNNRIIQLSITDGLKAFLFSKKSIE